MHMDAEGQKIVLGFCDSGIMQLQINSGELLFLKKQFYPELGPIIRWDDCFCCSTEQLSRVTFPDADTTLIEPVLGLTQIGTFSSARRVYEYNLIRDVTKARFMLNQPQ